MRTPLVSAFEISPICNFRCRMCYVRRTPEQVRKRGGLLPAEWWLETARQARAEGLLYPLLTGGEPFLYPGIQKLLSELSRMGMLVTMNTNGSLIDEAVIEWLQETPASAAEFDSLWSKRCCLRCSLRRSQRLYPGASGGGTPAAGRDPYPF